MEHFDHPSPHFNDAKMAGFGLRAPSSLLWGGGGWGRGLIVPFYSVQDCRPIIAPASLSCLFNSPVNKPGTLWLGPVVCCVEKHLWFYQ